jgi:hypothetical protein
MLPRVALGVPAFLMAGLLCAQDLRWRSGAVLARPEARLRPARAELVARLEQGGMRHVLVRFERSPGRHGQALWRAAGLELGRALGGGAFFARVASALDAAALTRLAGLVDVRELELGWKLDPKLGAGSPPEWTVVERGSGGEATVAVYVLLQAGVTSEQGDELMRRLGGSTFDVLESLGGIVAFVPAARLRELAGADEVAWVEAALPKLSEVAPAPSAPLAPNDSNRAMVQADLVQAGPYSLDGSGVNVIVYDGGTARGTHLDFGGRLSVRDFSGQIDHATHVAGTVGGSGVASGGTFRGMAPGVTIQSYGFEYNGVGVFLFTNPGDFESDYDEAMNVHGAVLANNSIGTNTEPNGFFCPIQGDYGVMESLIDAVVRGSLGAPYRVVWANGNERQGSRCDVEGFGDFYSTAPPATAKNHITVGALNSNDDSMTTFSSWGPTDDGRLKPDLSAPGCQSTGDGGVTSSTSASDSSYAAFCGTSMASPTVCGVSALLIEDWRAQFGGPDPLNATLKVLLAHTAVDRGNVGPDYQFGYGSVRAKDAIDFMRLGRFVEDELLETGARTRWTVSVAPASSELRLTLAWDDVPGQPNVFGALVNDLDLVVRDPLGLQRHVWTLDPANPGAAAVRTTSDHGNNLEQVLVSAPASGTWTVEVHGFDVPAGPQTFSLASSHALTAVPHVRVSYPNALPAVLTPGVPTNVVARIAGVNDTLVGGSPTLHVRYAGGPFLAFPMSALGGDLFQATLPPPVCAALPEFYLSAQGLASGVVSEPVAAPAVVHTALVASQSTVFSDEFQADLGWTVTNTALTDGSWERGTPAGDGSRGDPLAAFGGGGPCYLTDNVLGNSDVDGGPTRLVSPLLDLSSGLDFEVSYARWFANDDFDIDRYLVEISNDGGTSWTTVENVTPGAANAGWVRRSFLVSSYLAPTSQVRLRFSVTDNPNDSVTEAGLDSVTVVRRECASLPDCNANGILDADDIASGRSSDVNANAVPDECDPLVPVPKKLPNPIPPSLGGSRTVP